MDYRKLTDEQLDNAILYQCTYGHDIQALENMLFERHYRLINRK